MSGLDLDRQGDVALVSRAADFAARRHADQKRKGAAHEPYVNHLAEVASLLAETMGEPDAALVAAGWLHDTVEDTQTDREELERLFGPRVASLVAEVTDDKSLPKAERKRRQVEAAPHKSAGAKAIKLADKTSNLRSLTASPPEGWERQRIADYIAWAQEVVAGCRGTNAALEDRFDRAVAEARGTL
ncbi:UNVERIFIED_ORG: (p)ppGpp synthase/HD superfamily hydrolase [Methylobacterium sp. SuP10 SLI 274]|uniref:HD domain-containing protein n=1 Tax=Methylorubrum extorquens TaxID=408 RepID=UPI00209EC8FF|nr:HD domain-containing protein [Methylorubrum extorquens]MDF9864747.1 (p)ppGpp synthase/HD superfamily hydrolase [Methylorubrum pseudosasae]MDH6638328.1 (p)ppGpp synthase/HD superfamily hydrolase [Methylobacterium sp. SuP10 SLI 274]MDH6667511.1 (p)ppGpp synthase/HD superfamily hydrolase [Methylorubrum zatmanii]MCP1559408.1 (p)ppGpp synthase/HD superfamily hydrolase [Methylorubrum extorquens]MDF9793050.1 (p)ppGpp synthase/HD superfamily hydrolase [Methylorubrum extorquens]